MSRERPSRQKFLCGCCANRIESDNSDQEIYEYFGDEFTDYEYVVDKWSIRPVPKKLLDLVPVHETSFNENTKNPYPKLPVDKQVMKSKMSRSKKLQTTNGDFKNMPTTSFKVTHDNRNCIRLKDVEDSDKSKVIREGACRAANEQRVDKDIMYSVPFKVKDLSRLSHTIKALDYRTPKKVITNPYKTEDTIIVEPFEETMKSEILPEEINDIIHSLKFKKPLPKFLTPEPNRNERRMLYNPSVYFAEVKPGFENGGKRWSDVLSLNGSNSGKNSLNDDNRRTSTAQTELSKVRKKAKAKEVENAMRWKIIINKHDESKS